MTHPLLRACLILVLLVGACGRLLAGDTQKWCRLNNDSGKDYVLAITDFKVVIGNITIKKVGEDGDGIKLSTAKATAVLSAHTKYLVNFEPSAHSFALTFAVSNGDDVTEFNLKRVPKLGDRLVISPGKSLSGSPVSLNLAGFRRLNAPAFLTIN